MPLAARYLPSITQASSHESAQGKSSVPTITPNTLKLVCSALDVPPLFATDGATGRRSGYEPDAAAAVAAAAGLELE